MPPPPWLPRHHALISKIPHLLHTAPSSFIQETSRRLSVASTSESAASSCQGPSPAALASCRGSTTMRWPSSGSWGSRTYSSQSPATPSGRRSVPPPSQARTRQSALTSSRGGLLFVLIAFLKTGLLDGREGALPLVIMPIFHPHASLAFPLHLYGLIVSFPLPISCPSHTPQGVQAQAGCNHQGHH